MYRLDSIVTESDGLPSYKYKETFLYNEYDKEILLTRYSWDDTTNDWEESFKIESIYDTNKNLITEIQYLEKSDYITKCEWIYDTNNNLTRKIDLVLVN